MFFGFLFLEKLFKGMNKIVFMVGIIQQLSYCRLLRVRKYISYKL